MSPDENARDCLLVIFGATGDLTRRKLIPALYQLEKQRQLPDAFAVMAVSRRPYTTDQYLEEINDTVESQIQEGIDNKIWLR